MTKAKYISADTQVTIGPGRLHSVTVYISTTAANSYSARIYDIAAAADKSSILNEIAFILKHGSKWPTSTKMNYYGREGIDFRKGLYVDVTGTGVEVLITYKSFGKGYSA